MTSAPATRAPTPIARPAITAQTPPSPSSASAFTGAITIVMTLLGWSAVPLFITHFKEALDPWTSNGWRYGFSALLWAPVLLVGLYRRNLPPGLWRAAIVPAIFNTLGQVAFTWSFYKTDPTSATFGLRLQIVFVAVGAYLLFPSERALLRKPLTWLAIVLVLGGIAGTIFLAPAARADSPAKAHLIGVILAIISGLLFAGYALAVRKCMSGFHPVTAFASISQITAAATVGFMFAFGYNKITGTPDLGLSAWRLPTDQFLLLLLSAVIGIALGHVFYYIAIARLGVAVSSGVVQLQPFCVAVGSYWIFNQRMTAGQTVSGLVAVAGALTLLAVQWRLSRAASRSATLNSMSSATNLNPATPIAK